MRKIDNKSMLILVTGLLTMSAGIAIMQLTTLGDFYKGTCIGVGIGIMLIGFMRAQRIKHSR